MFYRLAGTDCTNFVTCTIEEFDGWTRFCWSSGEPYFKVILPEILTYHCDKNLPLGDFPYSNSGQFLVSGRVADLFKEMNAQNIDYYESRLIQPNDTVIEGYVTVVIRNVIKCINLNKSLYRIGKICDEEYYSFYEITLDSEKIPQETVLFRIEEDVGYKIVHERLKQALEKINVDGVTFKQMKMI